MISLKKDNIGELWLEYINAVSSSDRWVHDNREEVCEADPIVFVINDFTDSLGILSRNADDHVIDIYTKKMFSMELIEELNSTYGDRFFNNLGVNQFDWVVSRLRENKWAKSCFIPLVVPNDPGPRIPCLSAVQVAIRDNKTKLYATFRSQNAYNSYGNFLGLRAMQIKFSEELNVPPGEICFSINFPHIYRSDFQKVRSIVETEIGSAVSI